MHFLPFILLIAVMVVVILAPQRTNALLLWRVSPEARPPAGRLIPVALIITFVFTFLAFHTTLPSWQQYEIKTSDPAQLVIRAAAGALFLAYGCFACLRPIKFASTFSPHLRQQKEKLSGGSLIRIEVVSRSFGIVLVLTSAFLFGTSIK